MTKQNEIKRDDFIHEMNINSWVPDLHKSDCQKAVYAIEMGKILYAPSLLFEIKNLEQDLLDVAFLTPGTKNISYDPKSDKTKGVQGSIEDQQRVHNLLKRFSEEAHGLVVHAMPAYKNKLIQGRTSFRPAEIKGRETSYRKDDTRLHVDAFPSSPNGGKRILRVFSNVNPHGVPRQWRIGEPFIDVAQKFLHKVPKQFPGSGFLMHTLGLTKGRRTAYDHIMLSFHDRMKADLEYQKHAPQIHMPFPAQTTWIVMTDSTPHAAMSGQHLLEQTFYLDPRDMVHSDLSPLYVLERMTGKSLV